MAFTDDFTQASYPQNLEARAGWTRVDGAAGDAVLSNLASNRLSANPSSESAYRCTDQADASHYTQAAIYADCGSFVCVRLTNSNNFIGFRYNGGSWQVYKRVAGTFTQLGSSYTAALGAGDVGKLTANGNTITFEVNSTQRCLGTGVTESFNNTETRQGLVARTSGGYPWIDNFEAGTLSVPSDLSGNVTLSDVAPAGTLADAGPTSLTGNVTLDAIAPSGTLGLEPGTVTVPALRNWSGSLQTSVTIPVVTVLSMTTGAQVLALTDQTTDGTTANLAITSTSLVPGVTYMVAGWNADGSQRFAVPLTAV